MNSLTIRQVINASFFLLFVQGIAEAHECDAILEQGVKNTYEELRTGDFRSSFSSAYCNKSSQNSGSTSGTSAGGQYEVYKFDFSQSGSDNKSSRSENCGNSSSSLQDDKYLRALQTVVDKNIVDAWSNCRSNMAGVLINGELNGKDIFVTYVFRSAGAVTQAKVDTVPDIRGATCNDAVKLGTVINTGGRIQTCTRTGDGPVSIAINTDYMPARFFIPAVIHPKPKPAEPVQTPQQALEEKCKNWKGPGVPIDCAGGNSPPIASSPPGMGPAPQGYRWCVLDSQFNHQPGAQSYCFTTAAAGTCRCSAPPPGYPANGKPEMYGRTFTGQ